MSTPRPPGRRFLVLGSRELHLGNNVAVCRVLLLQDGDAFWGEGRDIDTELGRARAAARATLEAAEKAVPDVRLALEGLLFLDLFGRRHVALSVEAVSGRRYHRLSGIAPLDDTIGDAACLAVLSAIDRWIAR